MKHGKAGVTALVGNRSDAAGEPRHRLAFAVAAFGLITAFCAPPSWAGARPPPPAPAPAPAPAPSYQPPAPSPAPGGGYGSATTGTNCSTTWSGTQACTNNADVWAQSHPPEGLKGIPVPTPSNLKDFVANKQEAIRLGKALFWDMQVGSDGKQACASCHFHAGADTRHKNQMAPGMERRSNPSSPNPDLIFQLGGPNYELKLSDFPLHKLSDPKNPNSTVVRSVNDIVGSAGVIKSDFKGGTPGSGRDDFVLQPDPVFHAGASATRRVTGRNAPTVINAVFNFRNFWDGRAQYIFNGVNPFGARDDSARVYKNTSGAAGGAITPVQVRIDNASLASQASGPPGNDVEMSANGRTLMHIGKRLLSARPLASQIVSPADSVLGASADASGKGLKDANYESMIKTAFKPEWWNGNQIVQVDAQGNRSVVAASGTIGQNQFNQMQANFSLFFALAIQMYESTLVSDDTPFDRHMSGNGTAMTPSQRAGMGVFFGKGHCSSCHGGGEFTNASVRLSLKEPLQRMIMGNGGVAVYDEGFYNTAVSKTLEDIINGANDPTGKPLAQAKLARGASAASFKQLTGISPNITVGASERVAVDGASKTSTIRNVELTAPYFHNGSAATLRQVVEFYNRGGNFSANNLADLDADLRPLGLTEDEMTQLVDFMTALTDDRVRFQKAPFDHPQLLVPWGHSGDMTTVKTDPDNMPVDMTLEVPAVGATGYDSRRNQVPPNFLSVHNSGSPQVTLVARNSNKCADVKAATTPAGSDAFQAACSGQSTQRFSLTSFDHGSFRISPVDNLRQVLEVPNSSTADNAVLKLAAPTPNAAQQMWHIVEMDNGFSRLYNRASGKCLAVTGGSTADNAGLSQLTCSSTQSHQQFMLKP